MAFLGTCELSECTLYPGICTAITSLKSAWYSGWHGYPKQWWLPCVRRLLTQQVGFKIFVKIEDFNFQVKSNVKFS